MVDALDEGSITWELQQHGILMLSDINQHRPKVFSNLHNRALGTTSFPTLLSIRGHPSMVMIPVRITASTLLLEVQCTPAPRNRGHVAHF